MFGFGKSKAVVGLDIGSSAVKAVELKAAGKTFRVSAYAAEPVPPDSIVDGAIIDGGAVADAVRRLFANKRFKAKDVVASLSGNSVIVKKIAPLIPQVVAQFQQKAIDRMSEALGVTHSDKGSLSREEALERIRQEVTLFANRVDVDEELSRLTAHFSEIRRILDKGGAVGKRLDFMMQELNREANTLGSKSVDADVTKVALDLKLLIEQMREQIQNIE